MIEGNKEVREHLLNVSKPTYNKYFEEAGLTCLEKEVLTAWLENNDTMTRFGLSYKLNLSESKYGRIKRKALTKLYDYLKH